jgi:hypothetical protein
MGLFLTGVVVAMLCTSRVLLGQASDPVFVGAGDIGNCNGNGDEATSSLVDSANGTVFTIGDNAYPNGTDKNFATCYDPTWASSRRGPGQRWETAITTPLGRRPTSTTSGRRATPRRGTTPKTWEAGT